MSDGGGRAPAAAGGVLSVALDLPLRQCFDYLPPAAAGGRVAPGQRVLVPLANKRRVGLVLAVNASSSLPADRLRPAAALLDDEPLLRPRELALLEWAASYYRHPIGEAVFAALPAPLRAGRSAAMRPALRWHAAAAGRAPDRAPRQAALLALLRARPEGMDEAALNEAFPGWRPLLRKLAQRGLAEARPEPIGLPGAPAPAEPVAVPVPTPAQDEACRRVQSALERYGAFLLDGVTGSGKTEVYLRCAERVLAAGRQVLVLIPEIGLAGQTLQRFAARFAAAGVVVLHSGLGDAERARAWLQARAGGAGVVIGTRSAVWVPLARPGLIVVDEEHDLAFKQQDGFRYNARDVAVARAYREGVPVVLGSATPSLESLHNAETGRYSHLVLPERAAAGPPAMRLVDVRDQPLRDGLAEPVLAAMDRELRDGGQVLVFMNRRGFAPAVVCLECREAYACDRCDARLVYHLDTGRLRCHHCEAARPYPSPCPRCGASRPYLVGQGTQRLEHALARRFPAYRMLRIDRDATRGKGELERRLALARQGSARLLVGTQMLSKGHDFPHLGLVVLLDTDSRLYGADFRAPERLAQLLLQVCGRAGRAARPGAVHLQTAFTEHPLLRAVAAADYHGFARMALAERAAAGLPPFSALTLLRAEARHRERVTEFLGAARELARRWPGPEVLGPAAAPMERLAGNYRGQLLVSAADRAVMATFLEPWVPAIEALDAARRVRWSIDVDPQDIL